jgi:methyl-accepting chemotaxis protein
MSKKLNKLLLAQLSQNTDEISHLRDSYANIYDSHKKMLEKFNNISIRMLSAKRNSTPLSEDIANSLRDYAASGENLNDITDSLNSFSSTLQSSSIALNTIIEDCNNLITTEHESVKIISNTEILTTDLNDRIIDLETSVTTLSQGAQDYIEFINSITALTKSVANIAEHTGLLSLNAAIEAARAGDSGKGFAVVAEQVKILASLTVNLTIEIDSITDKMGLVSQQVGDSVNDCILQLVDSVDKMQQVLKKIEVYLVISNEISIFSKKSMNSLVDNLKPSIEKVVLIGEKVEERINQYKIFVLTDATDKAGALISRIDNLDSPIEEITDNVVIEDDIIEDYQFTETE